MDYLDKFCKTHETRFFVKLPQKIKAYFLALSTYILSSKTNGHRGLARNVLNTMTPLPYTHIDQLYGVSEVKIQKSEKYNMTVVSIGDSHSLDIDCTQSKTTISSSDFIVNQIATATEFVDLYVETLYIFDYKPRLISSKARPKNYMGILHKNIRECFDWDKNDCKYPNLRSHYIDLRGDYLDPFFNQFSMVFVKYKFSNPNWDKDIEHYLSSPRLKAIFQSKDTLINHVNNMIQKSKIQKQIDNVKDPHIKQVIQKWATTWTFSDPYIKFQYLTWDVITKAIIEKNDRLLNIIYGQLSGYLGVLMDVYTIARMFRTYRDIPNKNSKPAKNIIIFAGNFHTIRYQEVLEELGFHFTHNNYNNIIDCVNISDIPQPLFVPPSMQIQSPCPPCPDHKICNPKSKRCVLKTGAVGKTLHK